VRRSVFDDDHESFRRTLRAFIEAEVVRSSTRRSPERPCRSAVRNHTGRHAFGIYRDFGPY
jgi:hypothetical protein